MNLSIILVLFSCLVSVQYHAAINLPKLLSSRWELHVSLISTGNYKCGFSLLDTSGIFIPLPWSLLRNDEQVLAFFPYFVPVNPKNPTATVTYASMNADNQIYFMNIVDQDTIPVTIACLNHLDELHISSTYSYRLNRQLTTKIERLPLSLTYLKISNTKITQWPDNFSKLTQLKTLVLSNIGLSSPLDDSGHTTSLSSLYSPPDSLIILPPAITELRSLKQIILTNNAHLRSIQVLNGLPLIERLDVRGCSIERLPLDLPNLTDLYMTNNNLTNLSGIQTLGTGTSKNKSFYFGTNHIQTIPSEIRNVNNLYRLNMNDNELTDLTPDIFNGTTLRYFYIKRNPIDGAKLTAIISKMKVINPSLNIYNI